MIAMPDSGYVVAGLVAVLALVALVVQGRAYRRNARRLARMTHDLQEAQRIARIGTVRWDYLRDEVEWSDEYARLLGLEPGGRMTGAEFQKMLLPEYEAQVVESERQALQASARSGRPERREIVYRVRSRDGRVMDISALSELLGDRDGKPVHLISTVRDVTEERRRAAELQESERNLAAALRVADMGWFRQTLSGDQVTWSDRLYGFLGRDAAEGPLPIEKIVVPADLPALREGLAALGASGGDDASRRQTTLTLRLDRGAESDLHVRADLEISGRDGAEAPVLRGVIRDITEEVHREQELRAAVASAEQANKAKSDFLAMMSHELRTPMNGVLGMLGALDDGPLSEEQRQQVKVARNSANSLLVILNDILDATKIEAGRLQIEEESFELNGLVRSVIHLYAQRALEKGVHLDSRIDADVPPWIRADSGRIRQVLANLVSNAIKFTTRGEVILSVSRVSDPEGTDGAAAAPDGTMQLRFCVRDTGCGIPEEYHGRVFGRFEQLGASYSNRLAGTGLGLSISLSLAELMNGRMDFESREGAGSSFWLDLPVKPAEANDGAEDGADIPPLPRMRILVAEDNGTNQLVARSMLERLGQRVDLVANGIEAVDAVRRLDYDLVLMDVSMPQMDGPTATRRIRAMGAEKEAMPILALTAHAGFDRQNIFLEAGFDEVLTKPILRAKFARALDRWKDRAHEPRQATPRDDTRVDAAADAVLAAADPIPAPAQASVTPPSAPEAVDLPEAEVAALHRKLAEMEEEFGAATLSRILGATLSDLDKHLAVLSRAEPAGHGTGEAAAERPEPKELKRSFHSLAGICATLGCEKLTKHSRLLESLPDAVVEAPTLVMGLRGDVAALRAEIAEISGSRKRRRAT